MRVRSGDRNQRFVEWVRSLAHDPSQAGSITILAGINQNRLVDSYAYCQTPSRPMEMIHMMLYEEESKGLDRPRRYLQDGPCGVT